MNVVAGHSRETNFYINMALSFSNCEGCRLAIDGDVVIVYDRYGEISKKTDFGNGACVHPINAYWHDRNVIVEMSDGSRAYISNVGTGWL